MNGIHDLGGIDGFGPVEVEHAEPVFHAPWERAVFGMAIAKSLARIGNTHEFRHGIERMDPVHYLASPYYEHWLTGLATLLIERGLITAAELEQHAGGRFPLSRPVSGAPPVAGDSIERPRFSVGDAVRVRNVHPPGHTRCPRYVRGRRGTVGRVDRAFLVPDVAAHAETAPKEPTYSVRFEASELWGEGAGGREAVCVDLWQRYLEAP